MDLKNKKIMIVGMGKSGVASLDAISSFGADVSVYDAADIEWDAPKVFHKLKELGTPSYFNGKEPAAEGWDYIILSPGVPTDIPFLKDAVANGAMLIGELELAYRLGNGRFAAITGTNGKTTTTSLTGVIFSKSGLDSAVAGNIGVPVTKKAMRAGDDTWLVTEVSSFQLETTSDFKPLISAVLNLTPDHLDRHKTMELYGKAKEKVFANQDQTDYFIYNYDDRVVRDMATRSRAVNVPFSRIEELPFGAFVRDEKIVVKDKNGDETEIVGIEELHIPGKHNLENALAAVTIAFCAKIEPETIRSGVRSFKGVEHRLELVATIEGVRFVNDSKGTNPDASIKAIEAIDTGIVLIAGGYDKKSDFHGFIRSFGGKVRQMILIGATAERLKQEAAEEGFTDVTIVEEMGECVRLAFELSEKGDTVLLSPACASWDMYNCFEERGEHFKKCVEELRV